MPISRHATVSSDYLRLFAAGAEARGLDAAPIFAACDIDPAILGQRGARVGAGAVIEAWKRVTRRLGDPLFGLTLAEALPVGALSLIDYLVTSSTDVGDGLGRVARYSPLMSDAEHLTFSTEGNEGHFRFHHGNEVPYPVEMVMGMFARRSRELFGPDFALKRVSFAHSALGPRRTYDQTFRAPVQFDMPSNEVVFARDLAALPMAGANAQLNAIFVAEAEAALARLSPPAGAPSFVDTVKQVLADGLHERDLTLKRLAHRLGVSSRTLQRRLRAGGVTHRGLVRDVREHLATRSLATRVSQGHIARTLGYSGAGAFRRAFKRWSGMTPGQVRRARG